MQQRGKGRHSNGAGRHRRLHKANAAAAIGRGVSAIVARLQGTHSNNNNNKSKQAKQNETKQNENTRQAKTQAKLANSQSRSTALQQGAVGGRRGVAGQWYTEQMALRAHRCNKGNNNLTFDTRRRCCCPRT